MKIIFITLGVCILVVGLFCLIGREETTNKPSYISSEFSLHTGVISYPKMRVRDDVANVDVLWYNMSDGPAVKKIERLKNGDWQVTLSLDPEAPQTK